VGLLVNRHPKAKDLVDGFKGGYRYKETLQGKIREEPDKDGFYDHIFDCLRYICTNLFNIAGQRQVGNPITMDNNNPLNTIFGRDEGMSTNEIREDEGLSSYF
jgi:hypothetical protein